MLIGGTVPWAGAKRQLAGEIVGLMPPHHVYWEIPCGSMAVLFRKPKVRQESVVDMHGDLLNLARIIQHPTLGPQLYRRIRRTLCHEQLFMEAATIVAEDLPYYGVNDPPDLDRAYAFFVRSWLNRRQQEGIQSGGGGDQIAVRWGPKGGAPATRFRSAAQSMVAWRRRLNSVLILRRDLFDVLKAICDEGGDRPDTLIYCDPPYFEKGFEYLYEFRTATGGAGLFGAAGHDDHDRLAEHLHRFKAAKVMLSYRLHPRLDQLYPTWSRRVFRVPNNSSNAAGVPREAEEVVLANFSLSPRSRTK